MYEDEDAYYTYGYDTNKGPAVAYIVIAVCVAVLFFIA
jgi:hypothetical protein